MLVDFLYVFDDDDAVFTSTRRIFFNDDARDSRRVDVFTALQNADAV